MLMATCLCDAFFDDVAAATVEVLEGLGCEVVFPEGQTCCGQPAFNAGDWESSRSVLRHTLGVFAGEEPIVVPSGSCAAMTLHGAALALEREPELEQARAMARRTWELADFIVNGLGVTTWKGRFPGTVAFHRSCHTRGSNSAAAVESLVRSVEGTRLVEFGEAEQCCGFGGTFSVAFPHISGAMGMLKLDHIAEALADVVVSTDMGCLMQLSGLAKREGLPFKAAHVAQFLRDASNLRR